MFSSRDPKNYPNNKSLVIFNLNIWYLYLKLVLNAKYRKEGEEVIDWCRATFTNINVQETNKKYYDSFDKILELGGNITAFKSNDYIIQMSYMHKFNFWVMNNLEKRSLRLLNKDT